MTIIFCRRSFRIIGPLHFPIFYKIIDVRFSNCPPCSTIFLILLQLFRKVAGSLPGLKEDKKQEQSRSQIIEPKAVSPGLENKEEGWCNC